MIKKIEERSECLHAGDAAEGAGNKRGGKERKKKIVCMGGSIPGCLHGDIATIIILCVFIFAL